MARLKFGSIVTSGSGSLGGHTIQNSKGGMQLRNKPINKKQPSASQALIRGYNTALQQGWRDLTDAQRLEWNLYAINHGIFNKNGDKHPLSGHSLWLKYNFIYISNKMDLITSPYSYKAVPIGPELVINGDFLSSVSWTVGLWIIAGGVASNAGVSTFLQQSNVGTPGLIFRLNLDIIARSAGSLMPIFGDSGGYQATWDTIGCKSATGLWNGTNERLSLYASLFNGIIDNVSVRQIF